MLYSGFMFKLFKPKQDDKSAITDCAKHGLLSKKEIYPIIRNDQLSHYVCAKCHNEIEFSLPALKLIQQ